MKLTEKEVALIQQSLRHRELQTTNPQLTLELSELIAKIDGQTQDPWEP